MQKAVASAVARIRIDHIHWYVHYCTPSIQQQGITSKQSLSKAPTELRYIERSVFMKEVTNKNLWSFEMSSEESTNVPNGLLWDFNKKIDKVPKI